MNLWNQLHRYFSYESNLGTDPVGSTLLRLSLPSIFMMFMNTLLHIVDTIFVSWLGEIPMAAMSFTLAIQILVFALLEGVGAGTTALVGRKLGEGKQRVAVGMATSGLFLAYCVCLPLLPLIFPSVSDAVFSRLGAEGQPELLRQCWLYNLWTPIIAPFIGFTFIINCVFRCQGNTIVPLVCMMIANIVNMILDPIFIFVFDWGIAGAAIATLVGRLCAIYYLYYKMISSSQLVIPVFPKLELSLFKRWKDIIVVGFPVSLATGSVALGFGTINRILAGFGHHAVAAWMLGMRIEDFAFTVVMGVNAALTPFLAFNYGKKDYGRIDFSFYQPKAEALRSVVSAEYPNLIFVYPACPSPKGSGIQPERQDHKDWNEALKLMLNKYPNDSYVWHVYYDSYDAPVLADAEKGLTKQKYTDSNIISKYCTKPTPHALKRGAFPGFNNLIK